MGSGKLLGLLGTLIYIVFTVLPDSSTQMLAWPWVLIWQAGLICIVGINILNLWQKDKPFFLLGNKLDWAIALFSIAICLSTIFAPFPAQSVWQGLIALGMFGAVYTVFNYLKADSNGHNLEQLINFQAILGLVVVIESLGLWLFQTLLPELNRLSEIAQLGVNLRFDFSNIELRNWAPFGHQNYVAGYLLLVIPLFITKAINQTGIWRKVWIGGIVLGLIDLYTTSSRGGFLGLAVVLIAGLSLLLWQTSIRKLWIIGAGSGAIALLIILISFNNRLQTLITGVISGNSELFFRQITAAAGLKIGLEHLPFGAGLGAVPMIYQKYRPLWAEREAEMVFQLHSTPVQIWAELGVVGIVATLIGLGILIWLLIGLHSSEAWRSHKSDRVTTYGLFGSLLGYAFLALTDYQLDIWAISGSLVIIVAAIAYLAQAYAPETSLDVSDKFSKFRGWLAGTVTVATFAAIAWLTPVDIAWQASSTGFLFLDRLKANPSTVQENLNKFIDRLEIASQLAPWESYYPYQLGWNLAEIGVENRYIPLQVKGLEWLQKGIASNPDQEFGYNNAAWLSLSNKLPQQAETYFRKALELVPTKRSLKFGLGISLLKQNNTEAGLEAIASEIKADPIFITSAFWQDPHWQAQLPQIISRWQNSDPKLSQRKTTVAAVNWWMGNAGAIAQLRESGDPTAITLANALENKSPVNVLNSPQTPAEMAIAAWFSKDQAQRQKLLQTAWIIKNQNGPNQQALGIINAMIDRMKNVSSFDQWLRQAIPAGSPLVLQSRRVRQGFNVLSRHTDGTTPSDFFNIQENAMIQVFFSDLFQS
ncbi:lipid A core-O-antigen ligase-like enyme [Synechococcus sp. PCC 7502]|uniref:O-antigen ligase family protein n=1 Tax=Synechococcus sp. PCC 7502 TaxID=1173263 RepID=UPI00029FA3EC|nr:O-antigen ligase family protein [Synechococcus sp. PCC 7502]AFY74961.1 lipid A core-O-antigen ligase-like enyme [Synechococcus sp. PCC 7502]